MLQSDGCRDGRAFLSAPNLQNIVGLTFSERFAKSFVASPGNVFLAVDYSQIELRVMAHFSEDRAFVTAFQKGIDVHRQTASVIFDVTVDEVSEGCGTGPRP